MFALRLLYILSLKGAGSFEKSLKDVESAQRRKLSALIAASIETKTFRRFGLKKDMSYSEFSERVPVSTYLDWEDLVSEQKSTREPVMFNGECDRYQPTSGSSSKMKWIPYTKRFLSELDNAISPMLVDVFNNHPGIFYGKHYWSLSWIPTHLRTRLSPDSNDDMKLLPWWKRVFMGLTMAVPTEVSFATTSEGSMISSLAWLTACRDLSLISVWSPTFAINLFEQMGRHKNELIEILQTGSWGDRNPELFHIPCPKSMYSAKILSVWDGSVTPQFLKSIWPKMSLVSSWDTAASKIWAEELKNLFPSAGFLAKGLWATEGVVTIPYQGKYPLAVNSHFYEFLDPETDRILPPWGLKKGMIVRPILTTGSGFFRYDLKDQVRVSDFIGTCPSLEFIGRNECVDMTGEKLSPDIAAEILQRTEDRFNIKPLTLIGIPGNGQSGSEGKPGYTLICEARKNGNLEHKVAAFVSDLLDESFHYKLASEIGQLDPLRVIFHPDSRKIYQKRNENRGMILGDMKIEPIVLWSNHDSEYLKELESIQAEAV